MRLHMHEEIDVVIGHLAEYVESIERVLMPLCDERRLHCAGFFQVSGPSGRWPQMIALWEIDVDDHVEQRRSIATHQGMRQWMTAAARFRTGGFDRILIPHDGAPLPPTRPRFASSGAVFLEQTYTVRPGSTRGFVAAVAEEVIPHSGEAELRLEGFWRSQFTPMEHLALWSMPGWDAYGRLLRRRTAADEASNQPGLGAALPHLADLRERILIPLQCSPLGGGEAAARTYQS